ncbi:alpha/beta hydrolase family protein [Massilia soli]|uniref:Alpha/beta hydrolase n=1 Tax=Massilia soli TaxID=2792854 RepID=A0ABS7SR23_9BURK|nr:alpha/beta hydrolase [Massilia soli]MBZ2208393.1 alpha/beta hydrolase [Massilia soli]
MHIRLLLVALAVASTVQAAPPAASAKPGQFSGNTIKRHLFSVDQFAGIQAEFDKRKLRVADAPRVPASGLPMRMTATGGSGIATPLLIEHANGRFHVYAERRRPQHPAAPLPYVSQDVVFDTGNPEVAPVGTLSYPSSAGPFPGVVLVAGSGPHDRDGGMSLHKTMAVLADHLTRQGFAVLRYDKRGVGLTGGNLHPGSTTDDYADDALAAVRFLQIQPQVRSAQIGIVGHSEGAIIASMVAAQAPAEVRFIVMLGGTGLPGAEVQTRQDAAARRADGMPEALVLLNQSQERDLLDIAASDRNRTDALSAMRAATLALPAATKAELGIAPDGLPDEAFEGLLTPWHRRFLALDPRVYLNRVTCPVLALGGEKDMQVTPADNLNEIERALKRAAPLATVRQLAGLNHNFQTARTGHPGEYGLIEETIAPSALATISTWMTNVTGNGKR